jgi:hypothetical protein
LLLLLLPSLSSSWWLDAQTKVQPLMDPAGSTAGHRKQHKKTNPAQPYNTMVGNNGATTAGSTWNFAAAGSSGTFMVHSPYDGLDPGDLHLTAVSGHQMRCCTTQEELLLLLLLLPPGEVALRTNDMLLLRLLRLPAI